MTPVEYIERRLRELRDERPATEAGQAALRIVVAELELIAMRLKLDALNQLHLVIREQVDEVAH